MIDGAGDDARDLSDHPGRLSERRNRARRLEQSAMGDQLWPRTAISKCCGPGYASPAEAMKAPREKILYTVALYIGTGIQKPDYLATIDADPQSPTYSTVISRLEMPGIGDELHHMGWNACSSCHHDPTKERRYLIVPGVRSIEPAYRRLRDRSQEAAPAQGDRGRRDQGQDQPFGAPHGALPRLRHHHLHAGRCQGRGARRLPAPERELRDRRALGERQRPA